VNTAVINVNVVSRRVVFHTTTGAFHRNMGVPGDEDDIVITVDNALQLLITASVWLGVTALGVMGQQRSVTHDDTPSGVAAVQILLQPL